MSKYSTSFKALLQGMVDDYGHYNSGCIVIDACHLSMADKRLVMSHMFDAEEYADLCSSVSMTDAYFQECAVRMQRLLDEVAQDQLESMMDEAGRIWRVREENGERYMGRR